LEENNKKVENVANSGDMSRDNNVEIVKEIHESFSKLKQKKLSYQELLTVFNDYIKKNYDQDPDIILPLSIFDNNKLSCLEAIVKYLRENLGLRFSKIAKLIGRNQVAIGNCYRTTKLKHPSSISIKPSRFTLPCSVLKDRKLSVLENIAYYLKNTYSLTFHDIAVLLKRDDRTIWTVHHRALKKLKESDETR
jgi:hypothetical protein